MLTTIRDLLRLALPPGTVLRTAEAGAITHVRGIATLRATLPALPELRGGEIVLILPQQALALDPRLTLPHLVDRLATLPVAALGVVGSLDPTLVERAQRRNLALLELPSTTDLRLIERDIVRLLTDPDLQAERRAAQLYSELTQTLVAGGGVRGVVATLAERTGQSVACYSASGRLRTEAGPSASRATFQLLRPIAGEQQILGQRVIIRTIGTLGALALAGTTLDHWDTLALEQGASALALELAKEQAVKAAETRVRGDLLRTILSGALVDPGSLHAQATELGFDLNRTHVAAVCEPADGDCAAFVVRLQRDFKRRKIAAPVMTREDSVVLFSPLEERYDLRSVLTELQADGLLAAGLSSPVSTPAAWPRALDEAEQALALGQQLFGQHTITPFADLGVYRLLLAQRDTPDLWRFYRETLGALLDHDASNGELLTTLEGYFAELGNVSKAAERLHIHRNTLIYRLQRISEMTGIDWKHAEDQLALQLALKAHRVLKLLDDSTRRLHDARSRS